MKKILLLITTVSCFLLGAGELLLLGSNAEKIEVTKWVNKDPVELSEFKDKKVVVLFFWTLDSASVMAFRPMAELSQKVGNDKVAWIGIAVGNEKNISEFKLTKTLPFPVAVDNGKTITKYMPAKVKFPACAIISKDGRLAWRGTVRNMPLVLKRLLAGKLNINEIARKEKVNIDLGKAVREKNYKEAIRLVENEQRLKFSPDLTSLHLQLLLESQDTTGAIAMLDKTIAKYPQYIGPHLLRQMVHRSYFKNEKEARKAGFDSIEKLKSYPTVLADLLKNEINLSYDQRSPEFMVAISEALKQSVSKLKPVEQAVVLLVYAQAMNMCAFNPEAASAAEQAEKLFTDERNKKSAKIQKEYYQKLLKLKKLQK